MHASLLHVILVYSNPIMWTTRLRLHLECEARMLESGVQLTTVECAFGDREWELPLDPRINRVRVRSKTMVWNKENLINIGIAHLPDNWAYVAWVDADTFFRRKDWAKATVHALQHYDIVQPWTTAYDLGPQDQHLAAHNSFCHAYWNGNPVIPKGPTFWVQNGGPYAYPHPGYAWAATRRTIHSLGKLLEVGALGAGDHHMALALVGAVRSSTPKDLAASYYRILDQWEQRALYHINHNIGYVSGTIEHFWHGKKADRKYVDRWKILTDNDFDPDMDIKYNPYGVIELSGNKPELSRQIDQYFRARNEDSNSV